MGLSKQRLDDTKLFPRRKGCSYKFIYSPNPGKSYAAKLKRQWLGKDAVSTQIWKTMICFSYANHIGRLHTLTVIYAIVETPSSRFC